MVFISDVAHFAKLSLCNRSLQIFVKFHMKQIVVSLEQEENGIFSRARNSRCIRPYKSKNGRFKFAIHGSVSTSLLFCRFEKTCFCLVIVGKLSTLSLIKLFSSK